VSQGKWSIGARHSRCWLGVCAILTAAALAACGSSSSTSSGGGGSSSSSSGSGGTTAPASVPAFPRHPAPAGGNGGKTDVGVTATSIDTGSPVAASGPLPGAQLNTFLGSKAYYAYVNASGGIYGRRLNTTRMETGFDASQGQAVCTKYIPQMFALVATQSNVDAACFPAVKQSGIPWVGSWFDPEFYALPNALANVSAGKPATGTSTACALYKRANPSISKAAIMWVNTAGIQEFVKSEVACWTKVGVQVVYNYGVDPQAVNLTPYVLQAKNKGADIMDAFAVDVTEASRIAQAMAQQGWNPTLKANYATYDAKWHKLAGAGASGWQTTINYVTVPFLDSAAMNKIPGGAKFEYWWRKVNGSAPIDSFALEGWTAASFFAQGAIDAGPKLTRAKLLASLAKIENWNNDGLSPMYKHPGKEISLCNLVMEATADGYVQKLPVTCAGELFTY
jgi:ABC-type branched-subunit amino acid transport system substrate-binding protein